MEPVDRKTVLPAKVATFIDQRKIEDMPGGLAGGKAGVAADPNKNSSERVNFITVALPSSSPLPAGERDRVRGEYRPI